MPRKRHQNQQLQKKKKRICQRPSKHQSEHKRCSNNWNWEDKKEWREFEKLKKPGVGGRRKRLLEGGSGHSITHCQELQQCKTVKCPLGLWGSRCCGELLECLEPTVGQTAWMRNAEKWGKNRGNAAANISSSLVFQWESMSNADDRGGTRDTGEKEWKGGCHSCQEGRVHGKYLKHCVEEESQSTCDLLFG